MPPKRIIKGSGTKARPPATVKPSDAQESSESTEAELKFDKEVLWCISQFEKILSSGKLPEAKKLESIRAMNTLRKPNVPKIQKVQLMRQYFKDVKVKMARDEEYVRNQTQQNFMVAAESEASKGVFVKKKHMMNASVGREAFLFNFKDPSTDNLEHVSSEVESIKLS